MDIDSLTIGDAKELAKLFGGAQKPCPFEVGKAYLIRTVTMTQVGRVKEVIGDFLVLEDAAWVASTGRFNECVVNGAVDEVEPFTNDAIVGLGSICDATEWPHPLLREVRG